VQRGEPRGLNEYLLELDNRWDRAVAEEPVEGQPRPPLRTKMDGWVTVLCLFAGIGAELEGLLQAGIRVRKLLLVEIDPAPGASWNSGYAVCIAGTRNSCQPLPAKGC
jgi:hypothetical protein